MKKQILFVAVFFLCVRLSAQTDPILMTVNGEKITKSEFEYIYNKNNTNNSIDKKDLNEYVQLFTDLKLKVAEAESLGLDTTKTFIDEFRGYRSQSAKQYLTNNEVEEQLILQSYNRLKEEVNVSHMLFKVAKDASAKDTLEAYNKALAAKKRLKNETFEKVAKEVSADSLTAIAGGYIGYITGFQTVLPFENAAYSLAVGEVSKPIRTQFGYHIIKVNEKRPSQGKVFVAHIMKIFPQNAGKDTLEILRAKIDSIYNRLNAGEDFAELASKTSDHIYSAQKGGELGWFSTGKSGAGPDFENAAFSLEKGQYSKPVKSIYGYHIIKLIDKKPLESLDEKRAEIQKKLKQDERGNLPVESFKNELKKQYKFDVIEENLAEIKNLAKGLDKLTDSLFYNKAIKLKEPLFSFADIVYYQNDFVQYLKKTPNTSSKDIDQKFSTFSGNKLLEYEDSKLEEKYPEFKMLVEEYHDGMLMFDISSKEVWEKAASDTEGLKAFFEANKKNYTWDIPRFKGMIVYCKDKKTESKVKKIIKSSPADSIPSFLNKLNTDKQILVKTEKGLFVKGENKAVDKYAFNEGDYTPTTEFPIVFVAEGSKVLANGPDEYEDMKGLVTSDYQNYLQEEWMKKLRKKYNVVIFEDVLKTVKTN